MQLEKRFLEISSFLKKHNQLAQSEVLDHYPFESYAYEEWMNLDLTLEEMIAMENHFIPPDHAPTSLKKYFCDIRNLIDTPQSYAHEDLPISLFQKVKEKKRHEIQRLIAHIPKEMKNFVDVGGGMGHLASCIAYTTSASGLCLDQDKSLQEAGRKKLKKFPKMNLHFQHQFIQNAADIPLSDCLICLHGCGDLSKYVCSSFDSKHLLSLACCYHKCSDGKLQHSDLDISLHARTLAAKGYYIATKKSMLKKLKIKSYRYASFMYLNDHHGLRPQSYGRSDPADYELDFKDYIQKFHAIKVDDNAYPYLKKTSPIINLSIIRECMARVIEMAIILDRALLLQENSKKVKITQIFDRTISPRNLLLSY